MITLRELVCKDLGYCCPYAFFCLFKRTGVIAERLGVNAKTVRSHKAKWKAKELNCEEAERCLKKKLSLKPPPRY